MVSAIRITIGGILVVAAVSVTIGLVHARRTDHLAGPSPTARSRVLARLAEERARLDRLLLDAEDQFVSHGDVTPRSKDDPNTARVRGCVTRAGKPVPGAKIVAIVWPTNMSFTTDSAVAGADGCYELVITANHLHREQVAKIFVDAPLEGSLLVPVAPGGTTREADIEVGAGFVIRGVVRDAKGAPVRGALVTDGHDRYEIRSEPRTDDAGRFAIRIDTVGRVQLHVEGYEGTEPAVFDVERLDGEVDGVVLTVGDAVVRPRHSYVRRVAGAKAYTIEPVSVRSGVNPPRGGWCTAWARGKNDQLEATVTDSGFELELTPANVRLTCDEMPGFADNGREIDPSTMSSTIKLPVVPVILNGVELGVELRPHPRGARVVGVAAEAKRAGLQAGDIVVAVDAVSVVGFDYRSISELGFKIAPGHEVTWTIERAGTRTLLRAKAPGPLRAPLYLY